MPKYPKTRHLANDHCHKYHGLLKMIIFCAWHMTTTNNIMSACAIHLIEMDLNEITVTQMAVDKNTNNINMTITSCWKMVMLGDESPVFSMVHYHFVHDPVASTAHMLLLWCHRCTKGTFFINSSADKYLYLLLAYIISTRCNQLLFSTGRVREVELRDESCLPDQQPSHWNYFEHLLVILACKNVKFR